jgi:nitric oxide reductase subunit C
MAGVSILTYLGVKDAPKDTLSSHQGLIALAGEQFAQDARCQQCHRPGGVATVVADIRPRRDAEWLAGHLADPEVIAPGLRPAPKGGLDDRQIRAILSYVGGLQTARALRDADPEARVAALVFSRSCSFCHQIDGAGEAVGPDLTHIGSKRDAKWLREWINDPSRLDVVASMPGFSERLSEQEIIAISAYLSRRK